MTAQINDTVLYQGIWYALAAKRWHLTYYGVLARLPCALHGHRGRVAPVPHRAWSVGGAGPAGGVRDWAAAPWSRPALFRPRAGARLWRSAEHHPSTRAALDATRSSRR